MNSFLIIFFSSFITAQTFDLKEILNKSIERSPRLEAENFNLQVAESELKQAKIFSNPILTFQGGSLKSATNSGAVTDFSLSQPIPWPGKRGSRIELKKFLAEISKLSQEEVKLEVFHHVYKLVADIAALQEIENHYQERGRRFDLIEKSLTNRPLVSPKQKVDKSLIESQILLMEKEKIDLTALKSSLLWELRNLSGLNIEAVTFKWDNLPSVHSKDFYLNLLNEGPSHKKMKFQEAIADKKIEEARLEARPDILLGVNYRRENLSPINHFYHGQISIVIPILDHGQHSTQVARAEKSKNEASHKVQKEYLNSLIHKYYADYEASKKIINLYNLNKINIYEKKFQEAEDFFKKGLIDAMTLLQIDTLVHENVDQVYNGRLQYLSAASQLNLLIGKGIDIP